MKKAKKPLFNIGDTVKVKNEFWKNDFFREPGIASGMKDKANTEHIISYRYLQTENNKQHYCYNFEIDEEEGAYPCWWYVWDESWLELVTRNREIEIDENEIMNMF